MARFALHTLAASFLLLSIAGNAAAVRVNPVGKVLELLSSLEAKITAEGVAEVKAYKEFVDWCGDSEQECGFAIKTATKEKAEQEATIEKATSDEEEAETEIEELAAAISTGEAELKDATAIRKQQNEDFLTAEAELVDTVGTLERAIMIIEREMSKNPALLQKQFDSTNMQSVLQSLSVVIDAAALTGADRKKLLSLVQNKDTDEDEDDDAEPGAPAATVYKSHSGSIVEVLEDLKDKAEEELAALRKSESTAQHNFDMLKQSLEDQLAYDEKDLKDAKAAKTTAAETKAAAEGDLAIAVKDLESSKTTLEGITSDCKTAAANHDTSMASRAEELKALAEAKKIIASQTGGAEEHVYSLLQTSSKTHSHSELVQKEVLDMVKKLAKEYHSSALAQLVAKIGTEMRYGATNGEDPFAKVKGLITELIVKLEAEADAEAKQKAYCDEQMKKTADKKAELTTDIDKLTSKIDLAVSKSAKLKQEVSELDKELAALIKLQAEMDQTRADEHSAFLEAKEVLEQGIEGVMGALKILRDYYGSGEETASFAQQVPDLAPPPELAPKFKKAEGAGGSIISILELIESDFSKSLAEETVTEEEAATTYEKVTQENKITKAMKEQDMKYKTQEAAALDKSIAEASSDKEGLLTELDAVLEYEKELVSMCVAKPETYEERSKRRQSEISGLKSALEILGGESFVQTRSVRRLRQTPVQ